MALWTPANLTTAAWYDAADASTITESAGAVSQWDDKSGNDKHLVQATGSDQGTYITDTEVQLPTGKYMSAASVLPTGSGGRHLFMVINNPSTSTSGFIAQEVSTWAAFKGFRITGEPAVRYNGGTTFTTPALIAGDQLFGITYDDGSNVNSGLKCWVSGSERTVQSTSSGALNSDSQSLYVGADYGASFINTTEVTVKELVVLTSSTLSTDDRQLLEGYLAHKWGLEGNLPGGHPYKSAAPTVGGGIVTDLAGIGGGLVGIGGGLVG